MNFTHPAISLPSKCTAAARNWSCLTHTGNKEHEKEEKTCYVIIQVATNRPSKLENSLPCAVFIRLTVGPSLSRQLVFHAQVQLQIAYKRTLSASLRTRDGGVSCVVLEQFPDELRTSINLTLNGC